MTSYINGNSIQSDRTSRTVQTRDVSFLDDSFLPVILVLRDIDFSSSSQYNTNFGTVDGAGLLNFHIGKSYTVVLYILFRG